MLLAYLLTFVDILLGIFALLTYQVKEGIVPVIDVSDWGNICHNAREIHSHPLCHPMTVNFT